MNVSYKYQWWWLSTRMAPLLGEDVKMRLGGACGPERNEFEQLRMALLPCVQTLLHWFPEAAIVNYRKLVA